MRIHAAKISKISNLQVGGGELLADDWRHPGDSLRSPIPARRMVCVLFYSKEKRPQQTDSDVILYAHYRVYVTS